MSDCDETKLNKGREEVEIGWEEGKEGVFGCSEMAQAVNQGERLWNEKI